MDAEAEADLSRYVATETARYRAKVEAQRARGNRNHPDVWLEHGRLGEYRAICCFNVTGQRGRMDIYYGGEDNNPRHNEDHGHIVLVNGTVISWLEPADPADVACIDPRLSDNERRKEVKRLRNPLY